MKTVRLVPLAKNGTVETSCAIPQEIRDHFPVSALWYQKVGYEPPWIGYVAFDGEQCVGSCGFKTAPQNGIVEIAYGTAEALRGRGYATAMARALVAIALARDPRIIVTAQTLPHQSASTSVLQKIGFVHTRNVQHPEDGLVWEWELRS